MIHAYKKNDILFREGDRSDFIYRLVSGEAEVTTLLKGGSEFAGRVLPGEFIGEIGVLVACRRGATAQFTSDSEVEELNCADFLALVASDRDVSVRLLNLLSLRTRSQVELLQALPDVEDVNAIRRRKPWRWCLFKVRAIFRPVHEWIRRKTNLNLLRQTRAAIARIDPAREYFAKGDFLFREGEESQRVFWIESGKVKISKSINQRDRVIGTAGANEYLGEMGVLESLPRNASVVAERGVVAYCLTPSQFFSLMQASPAAYSVVINSICERVIRLRRRILDVRLITGAALPSDDSVFGVARSIESVTQLAERRFVDETQRVSKIFKTQIKHGKYIADVYQKSLKGLATKEEMERANAYFRDYIKMAGLGTLFLLPGGLITIPLMIKIGRSMGIEILPGTKDDPDEIKKKSPADKVQ